MLFTNLIGTLGLGLLLYAFIRQDKLTKYSYYRINFVASVIMTLYASLLHSVPFMILNLVWAFSSIKKAIKEI